MSEIDPRPMENHLLKICEKTIKLDCEYSATNTKHLKNICKFLFEEMAENDKVFKELFQNVVLAGSYPDNLKISEPDEYDLLMVLKFPNPVVAPSRPGYVTINISEAFRNGWNNGNVDYDLFVDDDGYLIQNKVLNWIRGVVRSTLQEHNNTIVTDEDSYEVSQSSNGPAVTIDVTVLTSEAIRFSIDFVACLSFNSDEWWTSDVSCYPGVWNAIPKPIKLNEAVQHWATFVESVLKDTKKTTKPKVLGDARVRTKKESNKSENENKTSGKVKRPPTYFRYKNKKPRANGHEETLTADKPNTNTRSRRWYRKPKAPKVEAEANTRKTIEDEKVNLCITQKSKWEKSTNTSNSNNRLTSWHGRPKIIKVEAATNISRENISKNNPRPRRCHRNPKASKVEADLSPKKTIKDENWEKSTANMKQNTSKDQLCHRNYGPWSNETKRAKVEDKVDGTCYVQKANRENPTFSAAKEKEKNQKFGGYQNKNSNNRKVSVTKDKAAKQNTPDFTEARKDAIIIPNPQENREWICSYAQIERQLLKGTQTMKPLIRVFKKIRDKKKSTNLKSYHIKTIFLHQNSRNGSEYWKQSMAVLFMEMFDVILKHLLEHQLDSFWHRNFNLFQGFRESQISAIHEQWLKMKNDLISNLENDNPEFIYDLVCTEEERLLLEESESDSEFD